MELTIHPVAPVAAISKSKLWTSRLVGGLAVLFLAMDGIAKLFKPAPVVEAMAKLGYPDSASLGIGVLLLVCTLLYAIPRTSILGAVLLTGYLGGAISTQVRVQSELFSMIFPVILGAMLWGALYLRDSRLRTLMPLRN